MRTAFFLFVCIICHAGAVFAESFNFKASEQYIVKGEAIDFTFTYDPYDDYIPEQLTIEFNYQDDHTIEHTVSFDDMDKTGIETSYTMVFDQAGYFDCRPTFRITRVDENGKMHRVTKQLECIRIGVANWKFTAGDSLGCIESTPALSPDGATVYVGSEDQHLYAVNTEDGTEVWRFPTSGPVNSSPAVDSSGNIFFGSEDGTVYCVTPGGNLTWSHGTGDSIYSSPALDQDQNRLYIGSADSCLYALDSETGERFWKFKTGSKIVSSPVIGNDKTIYIGSLDHCLYAIAPDGKERWKFEAASEILNSPALDSDGTLFFGTASFRGGVNDNNGLYALSSIGKEGKGIQKWFVKHASGFPGTPVIDSAGSVCVGSNDNNLYGINRNGGQLIMYRKFSNDLLASPAIGSNDYIFAGARDGIFCGLDLFKGDERYGRKEYWKYDLSLPVTTSSPVINNGYLYVGTCGYSKGALFSLFCDIKIEKTETSPSEDSPWPQFRNLSDNAGITKFRSDTIAPEIVITDPEKDAADFDINRRSISVTFSKKMEKTSIFKPATDDEEAYYGFSIEPIDSPPEEFDITWHNNDTVCEITLPENESFKPYVEYTASILSKAYAANMPEESNRSILYNGTWTFNTVEEQEPEYNYSPGSGCFLSLFFGL
ncbi:MAG: PQQ-binding-like beta-propeller repeat protein [Desulfobacteraceae bacterium]|nr:PQQ-binding-like beta-propeller repeat protein [Desulfobacteraceae bacterium]